MMTTFPDIPQDGNGSVFSLSNTSGTKLPVQKKQLKHLLRAIEGGEGVRFRNVELVYVNEEEIVTINSEYLGRNYVTDIITFRYDEDDSGNKIEGTLFCCAPRIEEQSTEENTQKSSEFYRVFIHGLLHLAGYKDQTKEEKTRMTRLENLYLEQLNREK
jgi:probable rRNA maturation factor